MVENAASILKYTDEYVKNQEKKLRLEIDEKAPAQKLHSRAENIETMHKVIEIITHARVYGQRAQLKNDITMLEGAIQKFDSAYKLLERLKANSQSNEGLETLKEIEAAAKSYENMLKGFVVVMQEVTKEATLLVTIAADVLNAAEAVTDVGLEHVTVISKEATSSLSDASNFMIIGLIIAFIISLIIAYFIIKSIVKVVVYSVKSLSEGTAQVVSASEQISSASVSLAEGASSQASSVEEVSATIEEATASNNQNADNSREANLLAQHSNDAARQGNQQMADLMIAMEKITDSSQKIAKIIKTIDEIAFQTNLLALNAAVEAARAGEHGL